MNKTQDNQQHHFAIIRIRGVIHIHPNIAHTLTLLKLYRRNYCVLCPKTPSLLGMIHKVKDYVTWGEIDPALMEQLQKKSKKEATFYRLNSPRKGYGRKGIKVPFTDGGALGYRGEKINDLLKRMM